MQSRFILALKHIHLHSCFPSVRTHVGGGGPILKFHCIDTSAKENSWLIRGKSSARPVRLDGLQILAESRSSAANATFDKVHFIHKTNEFSLILTEKGLKNT